MSLWSPVIARLSELTDARDLGFRLEHQRDRLKFMVDSPPNSVVIANATGDIIAQNYRAEGLLHVQERDSPSRRLALERNNFAAT